MKAIIHIGTPKTGTTSLQMFLGRNHAALTAQGLRHEPFAAHRPSQMELAVAGVVRAGDHIMIPRQRRIMDLAPSFEGQSAFVDRLEQDLRARIAQWPEHTYIASSEQLYAWLGNRARIAALHGFLSGLFTEVRYVVYFRPQADFMLSSYSEAIKRGELQSLADYVDSSIGRMNYYQRARMWAEVVGHDNLSVRLFDRTALRNGDLLEDFCATTGIDRAPLSAPIHRNRALSAERIELRLKIGRFVAPRLRNGKVNPLFTWALRLGRRRLPRPGTRPQLTEEQRARILAANAASNEKLRAAWFPDRATLFSPD